VSAPYGGAAACPTRKVLLAGALLVAALTGCNDDGNVQVQPIAGTSPSATTGPTPVGEQQVVLLQYRRFWSSLTAVSRMPAAQRRAALARYSVDPELKSLLAGMAKVDAKGQVFYGAHVPRAQAASISPDGATAVVNDCQDSTKTGLARRSDLAPLTKGVARNHVVVTMKRSTNAWRVSFVSYAQTPC
jgi:hypothetical protein